MSVHSPQPEPATTEQMLSVRTARLLQAVLDVSLGTVWQVAEHFWQEVFSGAGISYDERSTRVWHPAVSLRAHGQPLASRYDCFPVLHGTSGAQGPVVARGLTGEEGPDYPTSFGAILYPVMVAVDDVVAPAADANPDRTAGFWTERNSVRPNHHKPRLNEAEVRHLQEWARSWDLL